MMTASTAAMPISAKEPGRALRYVAVGLSVLAVVAAVYMMSGVRPEGWLLDASEATSSLLPPIALIVNIVSVVRQHRTALDIGSLAVSAVVVGVYVVDAIVYTMTG